MHNDTIASDLRVEYKALKKTEGLYLSWPETAKSEVKKLVNESKISWLQKRILLHRTSSIIKDFKSTIKQVRLTVESLELTISALDEPGCELHPAFVTKQMKKTTEMMIRYMAGYQAEFEHLHRIFKVAEMSDIGDTKPYSVGRF